jgi:glycosyltransferase involved in cell wall biosynthesis
MRIAQVATLSAPVRKDSAGSVESLVWLLTRELQKLGHDVTVFATGDSQPEGKLDAILPAPYGASGSLDDWHLCEWMNLANAVRKSADFDVLHTHAYLWGLPLEAFCKSKMVHTMHIVPDADSARLWSLHPRAAVTAISHDQWRPYPDLKPAAIIPHGLDGNDFAFCGSPDDYVLYLGRFVSAKGPQHAIQFAHELGLRLVLAGPENAWFHEHIKPLIDGKKVQYAGYVSGRRKIELLGRARALLYPIQYPESFGLVLVEAMLCGTPVVAMGIGAVPEIVEQGVTGFCVAKHDEFVGAIPKSFDLPRPAIRQAAERRFSAERMVRDYLDAYQKLIDNRHPAA